MAVYSVNNSNGRFTLKLTLTESNPSTANNTSDVSYSLDLIANTSWDFKTYKIGRKVVLNGSTVYEVTNANSSTFDLASYGTLNLASGKTTIKHNDDGSKSISVAYSIDMKTADWTPGPLSGTGSMTLTTIARASKPSLITYPNTTESFTMGSKILVHMNRKANFTHTVQCKVGSTTLNIATGAADNCEWDTSMLFPYCVSSKELTGTVVVTTYNGSSKVGDPQPVAFKALVVESDTTKPVAKLVRIAPAGNIPEWVTHRFVQGVSKITASMEGTANASANIASYSVTVGGKTTTLATNGTSADVTTDNAVDWSGDVLVVGRVTDSRGISSNEVSDTITVVPYAEPFLSPHSRYTTIYCARCDENGELSDSGESLKLIIKCSWFSLMNKENTATVEVKYYNSAFESEWIPVAVEEQGGGLENNYISFCDINTKVDGVTLETDSSYSVIIKCTDRFGNYDDIEYPIPTSDVCFHLGENGNKAAFGKYAEIDNAVEIDADWDFYMKGNRVSDFVIEEGISGIWAYRKWNSGVAECFGVHTVNDVSVSTAWGALFESNTISVPLPSGLFVETPQFHITLTGVANQTGQVSGIILELHSLGSKTVSPNICAVRPNAGTVGTLNVSIFATGRWK